MFFTEQIELQSMLSYFWGLREEMKNDKKKKEKTEFNENC